MIERVALKLQEVAPSRSYAPNPLDIRSGRSESSASQSRASRVIPPNPTRPARSHYCFLLLCKKFEKQRRELKKKVGARNMRMESLLGDPKIVKETLKFVEKTGRFNFV